MKSDRIGGIISIIFGALSFSEAIRLYPSRTGFLTGDHTLPAIVGAALIVLGLVLALFKVGETFEVSLPSWSQALPILLSFVLMFVYWLIIPHLGYVVSTFIVAAGLFKVLGSIRLYKAIIFGVLLCFAFYMIFIHWFSLPLPVGVLDL